MNIEQGYFNIEAISCLNFVKFQHYGSMQRPVCNSCGLATPPGGLKVHLH